MELINKEFTELLPNKFLTENVSLVLYSLIMTCRPRNIIEVGAGYSSLFLSKAIEDIKTQDCSKYRPALNEHHLMYTSNYNPTFTIVDKFNISNAEEVLKKHNLDKNIKFIVSDIFEFLKTDNDIYDFVWLDVGSGPEYAELFQHFYKNLPPKGIIIVHSTAGNTAGQQFLTEMTLKNNSDKSFEMMTFEEPHKRTQNSFTIFKRQGYYKTYSNFA